MDWSIIPLVMQLIFLEEILSGAYLLVLALGVELLLKELLHFTIGEFIQFTCWQPLV